MGRAERRRMERRERIENRKGKMVMSEKELRDYRKDVEQDVLNYNVEALFTCFALAQHKLYGFGGKRISRTLNYIDELMGAVINDKATIEDYKKELENETGVIIKCD